MIILSQNFYRFSYMKAKNVKFSCILIFILFFCLQFLSHFYATTVINQFHTIIGSPFVCVPCTSSCQPLSPLLVVSLLVTPSLVPITMLVVVVPNVVAIVIIFQIISLLTFVSTTFAFVVYFVDFILQLFLFLIIIYFCYHFELIFII